MSSGSSVSSTPKLESRAEVTRATASASSTVGARTTNSGGDELIEHLGQLGQVTELACRPRLRLGLAETVDPDRAQSQLAGRNDVVKVAGGNVDVVVALGARVCEEALPVRVRGLVGADLRRDHAEVDGH